MEQTISQTEILILIAEQEGELELELDNFWRLINIIPEKWKEETHGQEENEFWVVGICGKVMIWYNDIEEGFNLGTYEIYGKIDTYTNNQYQLRQVLWQLYNWRNYPERMTPEPIA